MISKLREQLLSFVLKDAGKHFFWQPESIWLDGISDFVLALAYLSISISLILFILRRRKTMPFRPIFFLFSTSTIVCGTISLVRIWALWHPAYWFSDLVETLSAVISGSITILLAALFPKILVLSISSELRGVRRSLGDEVSQSRFLGMMEAIINCQRKAEQQQYPHYLELLLQERTLELTQASKQLHQEEIKLRESETRFRNAFEHSAIGMALVDPSGHFLEVNQALCQILKYSELEFLSTTFQTITHPQDLETNLNHIQELLANNIHSFQMEERYFHKSGEVVWVLLSMSLVRDERGEPKYFIAQIQDITERKQTEANLLHAALHDVLTGLPNRALFMNQLTQALKRQHRQNQLLAVLFLDLDRFKVINDSLGHDAGDQLLIEIGQRLSTCLRAGDTIARFGGDEFAVLLEDIRHPDEAELCANRMQQQLAKSLLLGGHQVFVTASIGIALGVAGKEPGELLRDADTAMYQAKQNRASYQVFNSQMHAHAVALLVMERDLRLGLERQEFQVYYQPIISLTTYQLIGFEALIRWHHPQQGLLPPNNFLPVAEETGLIVSIDWWMMESACQQLVQFQQELSQSNCLTISVNLSSQQFDQANMVERVATILRSTGLDPKCLKLEITETVIIESADDGAITLDRLRELQVQLNIDDFGTGYSSLSRLSSFPIDALKIDRSFVSQLGLDRDSLEIIRAIISLAHHLGMEVIAEGIETAKQADELRKLGCEFGQGYLFSRPIPATEAKAFLLQHGF